MSDNIPFELQMEIIKKVYDTKSLIQFRSVSKQWKSFIDSSEFINGYNAQPHSFSILLRYTIDSCFDDEVSFIRLVVEDDDDKDNETFLEELELAPIVVSPLIKRFSTTTFVGTCHGLVCLSCHRDEGYDNNWMLVIWNPSIGKSFGIGGIVSKCLPESCYRMAFGFGVSPVTNDPTVVKILYAGNMPWHVEVFTLSSGVWNVIPSANLPRHSIQLILSSQVVIDRFIYWGALEKKTFTDDDDNDDDDDDDAAINLVILSFDLITNTFKVVDLPDCFTFKSYAHVWVSVSKLRESLVVYGTTYVSGTEFCSLWVMQHDSSFKKLFSIGTRVDNILGFRETGEPIIETPTVPRLHVYDPCSQQISNLGIDGSKDTFVTGSYKESLLLLDHSDLHIYCDDN